MTNEKKLKTVKILAIVVWIILLMVPTFYGASDVVTLVDDRQTVNYETDTYEFEIYCDKEIVSGEVTIGFYDINNQLVSTTTIPFEKNEGKMVKVSVPTSSVSNVVENYKIETMEVKSVSLKKLESILYPVAVVYAVLLACVLRINVASVELKGKKIDVYAGVVKHTIKVDGEVAETVKKAFFLKPIILTTVLVDGTVVVSEIQANHRITVYSQQPKTEQSVAETSNEESAKVEEKVEEPKEPETPKEDEKSEEINSTDE